MDSSLHYDEPNGYKFIIRITCYDTDTGAISKTSRATFFYKDTPREVCWWFSHEEFQKLLEKALEGVQDGQ